MKAKELIKEIIEDLTNKNAKQYSEIIELRKELLALSSKNQLLEREITRMKKTIEL